MRKNKSPGPDDITNDVLLIAGEPALDYLTKCFNETLKTGKIPTSWEEAKIIVIYKKGDPGDIKNYRPISLLSHSYKLFTRLLQTKMERVLDENQPKEQAGFGKGFSTTDHIHTLNQTWSMTKAVGQKLRVAQRAMERKMLGLKLTDKISYKEIRNKTQFSDIAQYLAKQKWKWAGHVSRIQDNRWTLRVTEWQPRNGKRLRRRQARRWRDDIVRTMGNTWTREAKDREEWRRGAEGLILQWMAEA
ncbi:RNA-directed DNA polymerase (Reverse transcriptase) domain containing protein [Elysia marginata]|uniref:RNA-directed DNA polymerase (Reverse transcriptase) domain containing protein n=1 Tax=Elysia marginata TaxID=1093978 RepID=A0AAV4ERU0_9GAST|nr:RNA-directed DNA polymerase (Reverse transcriptase) domain containing protein [Elysia marginata]